MPPYLLSRSTALSGVTFSTTRNSAEVPGWSIARTWSWKAWSIPLFAILPMRAPRPAPTARPKTGRKNRRPKSRPQNMPHVAPAPTACWSVLTWIFPSVSRLIEAMASGWMISSFAICWASRSARAAVPSSG